MDPYLVTSSTNRLKTDASVPYTALHIQIDNCGEILGQE